jgi:competence protein ComEA
MKKTLVFASLMFSLFTAPAVLAEVVNINKADVATLDSLDGIGEKKAEAIIAYRTEHGEFKTLEELKEVPGIGDKMFEKIKADISLTDAAATVADKPAEDATAKTATAEDKPEAKADAKAEKAPAKDAKTESADKADKVSDKEAAKADKS